MVLPIARRILAPPVRTPLPYGLLSVVQMPDEADVHWRMGFRYEVDTCQRASIITESCAATGGLQKFETEGMTVRGTSPFAVYTLPICSPIGYLQEAETRAVAALTSGEGRAVEREFWSGTFGTTPHLAANVAVTGSDGVLEQSAATVIVTGGLDVVEGFARIEETLGDCYGNEGVIHMGPAVFNQAVSQNLIRYDGPRLRSPSGHLVAVGAGYPNTGPDGTAAASGFRWVYATGAVKALRSEIQVTRSTDRDVINRAKNDIVLVAERVYTFGWDCCHLAQQISIGGIVAGTSLSST
jgi:hypothetical protein